MRHRFCPRYIVKRKSRFDLPLYLRGIEARGFSYLAKVITGVRFRDGIEVNSDNQVAA